MKRYLAETLGTFILVFAGTGAIVIHQETQGSISHVGIALTFGLVVLAMIEAFGDVSGAHMNPAVTLAFTLAGRTSPKDVPGYITSQVIGAVSASAILHFLFPKNSNLGATLPAGPEWQSFVLEVILTFILMLVVLQVATGDRARGERAAVTIGAVIALEAMFAGPICGASMNPARSLGPALISAKLSQIWIYLIAPVLGSAMAVPVWRLLASPSKPAG